MNASPETLPVSPSLTRRRRTFLAPLWLSGWAGLLVFAAGVYYWNSATTTTIVLVRHAEKQLGAIDDAPLSPQGEQRAARLAQMFGDAESPGHVQRIYVSDTRRSQQTAAALARRLGLEPIIAPAKPTADLARRALRENGGGLALIVGHSNTVPSLVAEMAGVDPLPDMGEDEFDTLYVVTVPTIGRASILKMKY